MNIIVCVKKIIDPEMPLSKFKVDESKMKVLPPEGLPPVINPYDAQAVEIAIRLKEKNGGKITILSKGNDEAIKILRHCIAMGADEAILINDPLFEIEDPFITAQVLSSAIKKIAIFDLILCGREAADWDEGITGTFIANFLKIPIVNLAASIEKAGNLLKIKRITCDETQIFEVATPALVTISNEAGKPRLPTGRGIILAAKKQIQSWTNNDLQLDLSNISKEKALKTLEKLSEVKSERACEMLESTDLDEATGLLAKKIVNKVFYQETCDK